MTDELLTSNDQEEELSRAYVRAVAAMSGYTIAEFNLDRDGTDLQIRAGGSMRPSLDIQLKATTRLGNCQDGEFRYPLAVRNYNLLRVATAVPNILVILSLPHDRARWFSVTTEELVMRRCAYWTSLKGFPDTTNREAITISVKEIRRFDVANLKSLMEQARIGVIE